MYRVSTIRHLFFEICLAIAQWLINSIESLLLLPPLSPLQAAENSTRTTESKLMVYSSEKQAITIVVVENNKRYKLQMQTINIQNLTFFVSFLNVTLKPFEKDFIISNTTSFTLTLIQFNLRKPEIIVLKFNFV